MTVKIPKAFDTILVSKADAWFQKFCQQAWPREAQPGPPQGVNVILMDYLPAGRIGFLYRGQVVGMLDYERGEGWVDLKAGERLPGERDFPLDIRPMAPSEAREYFTDERRIVIKPDFKCFI